MYAERQVYRTYREVIEGNPQIDKANEFIRMIDRNYWLMLAVRLRTLLDKNGKSHSFRNLMREIHDQTPFLTRKWFVNRFRRKMFIELKEGDRQFKRDWKGRAHISEAQIKQDFAKLEAACGKVAKFVDKHVAHRDRVALKDRPTFGEVHAAIDVVFELVSKYHGLLNNASYGYPVLSRFDEVFEIRWNAESNS
jgi:hypothetical protein